MSEKLKHTPGPWKITPRLTSKEVYSLDIYCDNKTLAEVKGKHYQIDNNICDANAKLIAAAPELLEACIEAEKHHQGGHSEIGFKLREAIKKATE
jgi:hypothetical protein